VAGPDVSFGWYGSQREFDPLPGEPDDEFDFVPSFTPAPGEVQVSRSGANTLVNVDTDDDPAAELTILLAGVTGMPAEDFIL
jgi:hypothetical protein